MQIHSLHRGDLFLSPDRSHRQASNDSASKKPTQAEEAQQHIKGDQGLAGSEVSEQITGRTAIQKTTASTKGVESELNLKDQKIVQGLKKRDRAVRAHEAAHLNTAGPYASGGPSYTYKRGPDGRRYAVGGEVKIDTSEVPGDPEATLRKAQAVRRAANAPANPSAQDRRVASQAAAMETEAHQEIMQERAEEDKKVAKADKSTATAPDDTQSTESPASAAPSMSEADTQSSPKRTNPNGINPPLAIGSRLDFSA